MIAAKNTLVVVATLLLAIVAFTAANEEIDEKILNVLCKTMERREGTTDKYDIAKLSAVTKCAAYKEEDKDFEWVRNGYTKGYGLDGDTVVIIEADAASDEQVAFCSKCADFDASEQYCYDSNDSEPLVPTASSQCFPAKKDGLKSWDDRCKKHDDDSGTASSAASAPTGISEDQEAFCSKCKSFYPDQYFCYAYAGMPASPTQAECAQYKTKSDLSSQHISDCGSHRLGPINACPETTGAAASRKRRATARYIPCRPKKDSYPFYPYRGCHAEDLDPATCSKFTVKEPDSNEEKAKLKDIIGKTPAQICPRCGCCVNIKSDKDQGSGYSRL